MIIDDFHLFCMPFSPHEADAPLVIDTDAVPLFPIPLQNFQPIRRWQAQVLSPDSRVERIELYEGPMMNIARELTDELTFEDSFSIGATERLDHAE
jgi:hypothetical protein